MAPRPSDGRDAAAPDGADARRNVRLLFVTRFARLFGYGAIAVMLALYLARLGFDGSRIGLLLSLTLFGDVAVTIYLTTHADRFGRRRTLILSGLLMAASGFVFGSTDVFPILVIAATLGVLSPSGGEVGPFLAVEQASLTQSIAPERRTAVFGWYNVVAGVGQAIGALVTGVSISALIAAGLSDLDAYRVMLYVYGGLGLLLAALFWSVSPAVEPPARTEASPSGGRLGLHRSRRVILQLSGLFVVDAFAGGIAMQSLVAYWFHLTYAVPESTLGVIFFVANLLSAASSLAAARIAARIGLIRTMVLTHLPSNVFLMLVPLMPNLPLAVLFLLLRFSLSQMDVPTRQSYTMAVVDPDERSAAAGVTAIARTGGAALGPNIGAPLMAMAGTAAIPFLLAGGLKILYDLALWRVFRSRPAPEEVKA